MRRSALLIFAGCSFTGADLPPADGKLVDAPADGPATPDAFVSTAPPGGVMQTVAFWYAAEDAVHGADLKVTAWPDRGPAHLDLKPEAGRTAPMFQPHDTLAATLSLADSHLTNAAGLTSAITDATFVAVVRNDNASDFQWLLYDGTAAANRLSISKNTFSGRWDVDVTDGNRLQFQQVQGVEPVILTYSASMTSSTAGAHRLLYVNGQYTNSDFSFGVLNPVAAPLEVGDHVAGDGSDSSHHPFNGLVGDLYFATSFLSDVDRIKLETYFALRYAITLAHVYVDSMSNPVYAVNDGYGTRVFGLANDANGRLAIGLSADSESVLALKQEHAPVDRSYLIGGDNNGMATFAGVQLQRTWKLENNWHQAVTLSFDVTPPAGKTPFLKYAPDAGFNASATLPLTLVNGRWTATGVTLPSPNAFLTLVAP